MPTIEQAKINYLHKKVVDRYMAFPSSDDEDMIMIFDTQGAKPEMVYAAMGYSEHPVFQRDNWVSEVAGKLTDMGYWAWAGQKISQTTKYRYDGTSFRVTNAPIPAPPTMGRSIFEDGAPAQPTNADMVRAFFEDGNAGMPAPTPFQP